MLRLTADKSDRLDRYLAEKFPEVSRSRLAKAVDARQIFVNGEPARKAGWRLDAGDVIELPELGPNPAHDLTPIAVELQVLFEDEDLLVVSKPRGMAAHPAPGLKGAATLVNALLARGQALSTGFASFRPGIVHRLDRETTGVTVVAKHDRAHTLLSQQIAAKTAERRYVAYVQGILPNPRLRVEAPMARDRQDRRKMAVDPLGKPATTHVKVLGEWQGHSVVAARLETGRTHQIRVHLASIGHPIRGDIIYARGDWAQGPLHLHAAYLAFSHPTGGQRLEFYLAPPTELAALAEVSEAGLREW